MERIQDQKLHCNEEKKVVVELLRDRDRNGEKEREKRRETLGSGLF